MADIRTYPFLSHLRADPTSWVQHQHNGTVRHVGAGQSFWFRPRTAALAEVPLDDREQTVLFHARTADFQDVTVASTVTYRVEDPALAATRTGLRRLAALRHLERRPARSARRAAQRAGPAAGGRAGRRDDDGRGPRPRHRPDPRTGLRRPGRRPAAPRPRPSRHRRPRGVGADRPRGRAGPPDRDARADPGRRRQGDLRAPGAGRGAGVGDRRERAGSQIEIARREQELVAQHGANDRLRATEHAAAEQITAAAAAEREQLATETRAAGLRQVGPGRGGGAGSAAGGVRRRGPPRP